MKSENYNLFKKLREKCSAYCECAVCIHKKHKIFLSVSSEIQLEELIVNMAKYSTNILNNAAYKVRKNLDYIHNESYGTKYD